ncbi:uncharacterized protein BJ171DRAFT_29888 [Polychytrium aggregatum]|uniref:uncharacterized protein n=1 Tax=Polychytrium aggregatum TaxID=110093 RepID=UPI0022FEEE35|nr:uncharacterized protein BJ171DRAFT_29888 [Polychytrium aggregatum]KAI9206409.1 hypothetical protein BJ171DRAFT_29888 [Polychytrium aggregatum]
MNKIGSFGTQTIQLFPSEEYESYSGPTTLETRPVDQDEHIILARSTLVREGPVLLRSECFPKSYFKWSKIKIKLYDSCQIQIDASSIPLIANKTFDIVSVRISDLPGLRCPVLKLSLTESRSCEPLEVFLRHGKAGMLDEWFQSFKLANLIFNRTKLAKTYYNELDTLRENSEKLRSDNQRLEDKNRILAERAADSMFKLQNMAGCMFTSEEVNTIVKEQISQLYEHNMQLQSMLDECMNRTMMFTSPKFDSRCASPSQFDTSSIATSRQPSLTSLQSPQVPSSVQPELRKSLFNSARLDALSRKPTSLAPSSPSSGHSIGDAPGGLGVIPNELHQRPGSPQIKSGPRKRVPSGASGVPMFRQRSSHSKPPPEDPAPPQPRPRSGLINEIPMGSPTMTTVSAPSEVESADGGAVVITQQGAIRARHLLEDDSGAIQTGDPPMRLLSQSRPIAAI